MNAVIGGMAAALTFGVGLVLAARSSRLVGAELSLAVVCGLGLLIDLPLVALTMPVHVEASQLGWLTLGGAGNVGALVFTYSAFRTRPVGIGAAILSSEGAVAAAIAWLAGDRPPVAVLLTLALVVLGVILTTSESAARLPLESITRAKWLIYPLVGAVSGGLSLFALGHVSELPLPLVALPPRLLGSLVLTVPFGATGRLRVPFNAWHLLFGTTMAELGGYLLYAWGARSDLTVAAVLQSTFGTVAALLGFIFLRERLRPVQFAGVVAILIGVCGTSVLSQLLVGQSS